MKEEFNGSIDNKNVKTIVKINSNGEKMWFAKPISADVSTPDFREKDGNVSFHQDSSGANLYRNMDNPIIETVCLPSGTTFLPCEQDIAILPITRDNEGYSINYSVSGAEVFLTYSGALIMIARGKLGDWIPKK